MHSGWVPYDPRRLWARAVAAKNLRRSLKEDFALRSRFLELPGSTRYDFEYKLTILFMSQSHKVGNVAQELHKVTSG